MIVKKKTIFLEGGTANPSNNLKLSQVIERAKKANMPVASIKSLLEKMEARKNKTQTGVTEVRGPNGYVMLVCYITDKPKAFLIELNSKLKKTKYEQYGIFLACKSTYIRNMLYKILNLFFLIKLFAPFFFLQRREEKSKDELCKKFS